MELKKTLWIITAAGFFLAVVILFAMNFPFGAGSATEEPRRAATNPISAPVQDNLYAAPASVDGNAVSNLASVDSLEVESLNVETVNVENLNLASNGTVTIDLNGTSESGNVIAKSDAAKEAMANKKESEKASTIYTADPVAKSSSEKAAEKKAASMNKNLKNTVSGSAKTAPAASIEAPKYWVQAASYTSKKTADGARATLEESRIPAEVFTFKDSKNQLYYRLRVGPYTTKSEAEYWKNRVAQIDQFKNVQSYITVN
ncbi:MAG: SPOR domain-containing protein [Treponema sp.]|nr:SPOR domain-containing protein [Candidatus Treponema scatequi]